MDYYFTQKLTEESHEEPILISGSESQNFPAKEYLTIANQGRDRIFQINYKVHCSPFKQAMIIDNILAVGFEEFFYLFNLDINQNYLSLRVDGYFGEIYYSNDMFFVADACGLHCIDKTGRLIWENTNLAIDGVVIDDFSENEIFGKGEQDPPDGWTKFKLELRTGKIVRNGR